MVVGPIAFAYNLEGVDKLVLHPEVLSNIFTGKITTWNDPAIARAEPRRHAAEQQDLRLLPLRRVGHHRERREVPGRGRQRRLDRRAEQGLGRHR